MEPAGSFTPSRHLVEHRRPLLRGFDLLAHHRVQRWVDLLVSPDHRGE
jgi:hypothetical protein